MKITVNSQDLTSDMHCVEMGNLFRFANGKDTSTVFIALQKGQDQFQSYWFCKSLANGAIKRLYIYYKNGRKIVFVEPLEFVGRDTSAPHGAPPPYDLTDVSEPKGPITPAPPESCAPAATDRALERDSEPEFRAKD